MRLGAARPVVGQRVGVEAAGRREARRRDGLGRLLELHQALLRVLVPVVVDAVGTGRREGPEVVEGDAVHRIDVAQTRLAGARVLRLAVALEREVPVRVLRVDVVDADAALDAANGEALAVRKGRDAARLVS